MVQKAAFHRDSDESVGEGVLSLTNTLRGFAEAIKTNHTNLRALLSSHSELPKEGDLIAEISKQKDNFAFSPSASEDSINVSKSGKHPVQPGLKRYKAMRAASEINATILGFEEQEARCVELLASMRDVISLYRLQTASRSYRITLNMAKLAYLSQNYSRATAFFAILFLPGIWTSVFFASGATGSVRTSPVAWVSVTIPLTFVVLAVLMVLWRYPTIEERIRELVDASLSLFTTKKQPKTAMPSNDEWELNRVS